MIKISCIYQIIDKFPIVGSLLNYFLKLNIFQDRKRRYLPHCCSDIVINRTYKSFKYKVTWKYVHSPFKVSCSQLIIQIICASQILCDNVHTFKCVNYYQFFLYMNSTCSGLSKCKQKSILHYIYILSSIDPSHNNWGYITQITQNITSQNYILVTSTFC